MGWCWAGGTRVATRPGKGSPAVRPFVVLSRVDWSVVHVGSDGGARGMAGVRARVRSGATCSGADFNASGGGSDGAWAGGTVSVDGARATLVTASAAAWAGCSRVGGRGGRLAWPAGGVCWRGGARMLPLLGWEDFGGARSVGDSHSLERERRSRLRQGRLSEWSSRAGVEDDRCGRVLSDGSMVWLR